MSSSVLSAESGQGGDGLRVVKALQVLKIRGIANGDGQWYSIMQYMEMIGWSPLLEELLLVIVESVLLATRSITTWEKLNAIQGRNFDYKMIMFHIHSAIITDLRGLPMSYHACVTCTSRASCLLGSFYISSFHSNR